MSFSFVSTFMVAKTDPLKTLLILEDQSIVGKRAWQVATATRLSQLAMWWARLTNLGLGEARAQTGHRGKSHLGILRVFLNRIAFHIWGMLASTVRSGTDLILLSAQRSIQLKCYSKNAAARKNLHLDICCLYSFWTFDAIDADSRGHSQSSCRFGFGTSWIPNSPRFVERHGEVWSCALLSIRIFFRGSAGWQTETLSHLVIWEVFPEPKKKSGT